MIAKIVRNADLSDHNTLGLNARCDYYCAFDTHEKLSEALEFADQHDQQVFVLGGGSNVLLDPDINGLVLTSVNQDLEVSGDCVRVGAGFSWDALVAQTLGMGLYGLENLSGIPGTVGAAPVQNIGAYGVELSEFVTAVEVFDVVEQKLKTLSATDCDFGYRSSLFRENPAKQLVILAIRLQLSTIYRPRLDYEDLKNLSEATIANPERLRSEILMIRKRKLPDFQQYGNAGSFFKNPWITSEQKMGLQRLGVLAVDNVALEPAAELKVSAARLIEAANADRFQVGGARVSRKHTLVLENGGGASLVDFLRLADQIQRSVLDRFAISLELEPTRLSALAKRG
ncbi:MAG: UDP-N-acetylenolpyruvoylglucosamine reductase [Gammaproteobacteria bacterium]|nr:UDP-N-acetylenolpyruvoylglucosamine reductase [Gammaproteobacteria bacterium]